MHSLDFETDELLLGEVISVDTASVLIKVKDEDTLSNVQVNRLVSLQSGFSGKFLIGIIQKITSKEEKIDLDDTTEQVSNIIKVSLIGTLFDSLAGKKNVFRRSIESIPSIKALCYKIEGDLLTNFMRVISNINDGDEKQLTLGTYAIDTEATAYLDGNKFFQKHAVIVGSTGSGKSWTTANLVEQTAQLKNGNAVLFDLHNEYKPLTSEGITHFRIASPNDIASGKSLNDNVIYLPYWLLGYEDMVSMLVDRSDNNAPNQTMLINKLINEEKKRYLEEGGFTDILSNYTIDSPIPYSLEKVIEHLKALDVERVPGAKAGTDKAGEFNGKLTRLIARIEAKNTDRRFGFMFNNTEEINSYDWLQNLGSKLFSTSNDSRVKVLDFSEVPSDILPLIVSLVAKIAFSIQQWTPASKRHPISLFCDEAHLYVPDRTTSGIDESALRVFERIAKEGRKYGLGLVIITQRPSEVSRTILSQCNNFISMRLTNADDQAVIKRLLPDSLGGFSDVLPTLDTGEALVVGDATILPTRIRINEPKQYPDSGTIPFWSHWSKNEAKDYIKDAVESWRSQSTQNA